MGRGLGEGGGARRMNFHIDCVADNVPLSGTRRPDWRVIVAVECAV